MPRLWSLPGDVVRATRQIPAFDRFPVAHQEIDVQIRAITNKRQPGDPRAGRGSMSAMKSDAAPSVAKRLDGDEQTHKEKRHGDHDVAIGAAVILPGVPADENAVRHLSQQDGDGQSDFPVPAEEEDRQRQQEEHPVGVVDEPYECIEAAQDAQREWPAGDLQIVGVRKPLAVVCVARQRLGRRGTGTRSPSPQIRCSRAVLSFG